MAFTPKPGSGSLFKNDRKEKDTQPDYRGDVCLEDGTILKLAGWIKKSSGGKTFLSLKVETPREAQSKSDDRTNPRRGFERIEAERRFDDIDDEIPF